MAVRQRWRGVALAGVALGLAVTLQPGPSVGGTAPQAAPRVTSETLSFDRLPGPRWQFDSCPGLGSATVAHGVLELDSPDEVCPVSYALRDPRGVWQQQVDNARGWVLEAAMRLDPTSGGDCLAYEGVGFYISDGRNRYELGIGPGSVCEVFPVYASAPVDTTGGFHVYRIESRGRILRVYVDGRLVIDQVQRWAGANGRLLAFGDFSGTETSVAQWDYVRYQTHPRFDPADWVGSDWPPGTPLASAARRE